MRRYKWSMEEYLEAVRMRADGATYKQIGEAFDASAQEVWRRLKQYSKPAFDCFAYQPQGVASCSCLKSGKCSGKSSCTFYKTKDQVSAERERSRRRLVKLGVIDYFLEKYGEVVNG